jgi:hypothetical protein
MKKALLLSALSLCVVLAANAQVGIGTTTPNTNAALDVQSTSKGLLIPRLTDAQRTAIASPAEGLMVYQTTAPSGFYQYTSGQWLRMATTADVSAATGFAANTSGSVIAVLLGGTSVPLPDAQNLAAGITVNGANTVFTVANAGRYRLWYKVNLTASLLVSSRLMINGVANTATTFTPVLAASGLEAEAVVTLTAGATVSLQLFGLLGAAVLLNNSQGAALTIQRVE